MYLGNQQIFNLTRSLNTKPEEVRGVLLIKPEEVRGVLLIKPEEVRGVLLIKFIEGTWINKPRSPQQNFN